MVDFIYLRRALILSNLSLVSTEGKDHETNNHLQASLLTLRLYTDAPLNLTPITTIKTRVNRYIPHTNGLLT